MRTKISLAVLSLLCLNQFGALNAKMLNLTDFDNTMKDELLYSELYNATVEWGIYKPDVFFGTQNRKDGALAVGLMWIYKNVTMTEDGYRHYYKLDDYNFLGVNAYYDFNDATCSSRQFIDDHWSNMKVTTEFMKEFDLVEGTENLEYTSSWTTKFQVQGLDGKTKPTAYPLFYVAKEGNYQVIQPTTGEVVKAFGADEAGATLTATDNGDGSYTITHQADKNVVETVQIFAKTGQDSTMFGDNLATPEWSQNMWDITGMWNAFHEEWDTKKDVGANANIVFVKAPQNADTLEYIVKYTKVNQSKPVEEDPTTYETLVAQFDAKFKIVEEDFYYKYGKVFGYHDEFNDTMPKGNQFAREAFSNLVGGIGYFYGSLRVQDQTPEDARKWHYDDPSELFTGTPSRVKFPRGFLWDEGFHLQLTCQWNKMICMDILSTWFHSIKENGWIPREQMRGKEAESNYDGDLFEEWKAGNPPSFMFVLEYLLKYAKANDNEQRIVKVMEKLRAPITLWFNWFNTNLANKAPNLDGTYQWMDVGREGALSSGLDDYPRGYREIEKAAVHSDLQGWMILFSRFMGDFIDLIEDKEGSVDAKVYRDLAAKAQKMLDVWCWDQDNGFYTDRIIYEDNPEIPFNIDAESIPKTHIKRQLAAFASNYKGHDTFSPHKGIINLFTIAFGLIDKNKHERMDNALRFAADKNEIFSAYGLRGVSTRDEQYFPGTGYWRGPVWVSVNYLVLRGLKLFYNDYVPEQGINEDFKTTQELYTAIRKNLLQAVYNSWEPEHQFYENWNDVTGQGQFSHPFTGWTTLVLLIFSEKYI